MGAHAARPGAGAACAAWGGAAPRARDFGDVTLRRWGPDRERRRAQNATGGRGGPRDRGAGSRPRSTQVHARLISGDCTVGVGTMASAPAAGAPSARLLRMHPDLNTPESVGTGTLDWMDIAHMLGLADTAAGPAASPRLARRHAAVRATRRTRRSRREREAIEAHGISRSWSRRSPPTRAGPPRAPRRGSRPLPRALRRRRRRLRRPAAVREHRPRHRPPVRSRPRRREEGPRRHPRAGLTVTEHNPPHGATDGSTSAALASSAPRRYGVNMPPVAVGGLRPEHALLMLLGADHVHERVDQRKVGERLREAAEVAARCVVSISSAGSRRARRSRAGSRTARVRARARRSRTARDEPERADRERALLAR